MSKQPTYRYVFTVYHRSNYSDVGDDKSFSLIVKSEGFDTMKAKFKAKKLVEKDSDFSYRDKISVELREVEEL